MVVSEPVSEQIGTGKKSRNRYRSNLVPIKSLGTGIGEIWYRKKVSEPVSEKFDTGTEFRCQNLGILKIYNGYRYRIGTGTENFSFLWWYRNRYRKNLVPEKSLGTGIGQIWYRKKVSEPVSGKFGTGKKYRYRYRKYLVPEKSIGIGIVQHFGYRHTLLLTTATLNDRLISPITLPSMPSPASLPWALPIAATRDSAKSFKSWWKCGERSPHGPATN